MGKTIVFCADGTWNGPGPHAAGAGRAPELPTNVFDFYRLLAPTSPGEPSLEPEQEKTVSEGDRVVQVAKYLHGVGHSDNWLT
ncbi:MAG: phospholipase effector Tle1 domain-containing protein, partial [Bacteroidota bacterium]